MNRHQAIQIIEGLFPPDYGEIGRELLAQAKQEAEDWRTLPDVVLFRYAELCEERERKLLRGGKHGETD